MKCLDRETELHNKECPKCEASQAHNNSIKNSVRKQDEGLDPNPLVSGGTLIAYSIIAMIGIIPGMILATLLIYEGYDAWAGLVLIALPLIGIIVFKFLRRFAFIVFPIIVVAISFAVLENI